MGKLKSENRNFTIPGNPMTPKEIDEMILQAETGKFYSMEELKKKVLLKNYTTEVKDFQQNICFTLNARIQPL